MNRATLDLSGGCSAGIDDFRNGKRPFLMGRSYVSIRYRDLVSCFLVQDVRAHPTAARPNPSIPEKVQ